MSKINLKLDEQNNLAFKVDITGTEPSNETPEIRFVCESKNMSYFFRGELKENGEAEVEIPSMKGKLFEGTYNGKLEVILEDKYFVPLELEVEFKETTKVVAEVVQKRIEPKTKTNKVSATLLKTSTKKPKYTSLSEKFSRKK